MAVFAGVPLLATLVGALVANPRVLSPRVNRVRSMVLLICFKTMYLINITIRVAVFYTALIALTSTITFAGSLGNK